MHDTGGLGLVHWDDPEGWNGEGGKKKKNNCTYHIAWQLFVFLVPSPNILGVTGEQGPCPVHLYILSAQQSSWNCV